MNDASALENARIRQEIKALQHRVDMYREMAGEAHSALVRQLRGEPVEGWLDPKPIEPESNFKLNQRLNQAKNISHSRYEQLKCAAARDCKMRLAFCDLRFELLNPECPMSNAEIATRIFMILGGRE